MVSLETETIKLLYELKDLKGTLMKIEELSYEIEDRLSGSVIFEDHISFIHEFYPIFEIGLEIIFQYFPEKLDLAYRFIESTKAISLYKSFKLSNETKKQTQSAVLENYRMLSSEANQFKLKQSLGDSSLETSTRLYALNTRMETLKKILVSDDNEDFITMPQYQESLKDKMHVLSFAGKKHYYFLQISESTAHLFRRDAISIESLASRYIEKVSTFQSENYREAAIEMGIFLEPILISSDNSNLLFTGDGALSQMPLESLVTSNGDFLLMSSSITYAPSARIQYFLAKKPSTLLPKALVFHPSFDEEILPLRFAKRESQAVLEETKANLFTGKEATKQAFFEQSENYDIIHLATHAKSVDNDPSKSYIQLSNSKLYFDEIKSLMLNAELVYLSACQTNTGKTYNGEGVQSLSRNFIASGAKSIVSSLWEIPDNCTSEITISFYQYLKKGYSKSESLQKAKIDFIKRYPEEGLHPYSWAGLVLSGNEVAIFRKTSKVAIAGASGILIFLLLLILFSASNLRKPQNSPVLLG
jgi:CHAT domain-containing protein